jgi:hypothetical protein
VFLTLSAAVQMRRAQAAAVEARMQAEEARHREQEARERLEKERKAQDDAQREGNRP